MKKKVLFILLVFSLLLLSGCLSGCSRGGVDVQPNTQTQRFYQGTEGIRMLVDPGAPPPRLYYYSDAPTDDYNAFSVDVEVQNVGASWAKGGIYVSGYDPTLIYLEGINIPKTGGGFFDNCRIDLNAIDLSWDSIGGVIGCNFGDSGVEIGGDPTTGQGIDSISINNLFQLFGWDEAPEIDVNWDGATESYNFNFDFSVFGLDLDVLNHGKALLVILDSINFDRFNGKSFLLEPDNYEYPGGGTAYISFPGQVENTWPAGLDETDVTFLISACYAYSTYATPIVCIDPAPFSENEKVCYPGQINLKGSQGAPIAVTGVYQENTPRSVIFTIEIQNVGKGDVIYPGDLELCSPYYPGLLGPQSLDTVILGDIRLSGSTQRLSCVPNNNIIKLRDGKGQITCTYDLEYATAKSAYKAPLIIELWYGYSETLKRNVHIKRVS